MKIGEGALDGAWIDPGCFYRTCEIEKSSRKVWRQTLSKKSREERRDLAGTGSNNGERIGERDFCQWWAF